MNKCARSIELLNKAVGMEISTVLQYIYFFERCQDRGYELLAKFFRNTAIQEMQHIDKLSERILFLEGDIDMTPAFAVKQIHDVPEMLRLSQQLEATTIDDYNAWAKECGANADAVSHRLFENLVKREEDHEDDFRTELDNVKTYDKHYMALQAIGHIKDLAAQKPEDDDDE